MNALVPLIYHPMKILLVDDNLEILKAMENELKAKYEVTAVNSAKKAIAIITSFAINNSPLFKDITDEHELNLIDGNNELSTLQFTIDNLINIVKDNNKYQRYGLVITDYEMPKMDGIELCRNILTISIKKILLTAKYDANYAITALNDNIIDCYLKKGNATVIEELYFYIDRLLYKHFIDVTNVVLESIDKERISFLFDPTFASLLKDKIQELAITEYYLISKYGAFLLKNADSSYVLATYNDKVLEDFCNMALYDCNLKEAINKVQTRQSIPFSGIGLDAFEINPSNWQEILYKANKYGEYYWALIPQQITIA